MEFVNITDNNSNIFGLDDDERRSFQIYGYQGNKSKESGILYLGMSHMEKKVDGIYFENKITYFTDDDKVQIDQTENNFQISNDGEFNLTNENSDKFFEFEKTNKSSEISSNMIEFVDSDQSKRIQIINTTTGFTIFYMKQGMLDRYEEYHFCDDQDIISMDQDSFSILKAILRNIVNKYDFQAARRSLTRWQNSESDSESESDDDLDDTEKEMASLGIYEEAEDDDDDDDDDDEMMNHNGIINI